MGGGWKEYKRIKKADAHPWRSGREGKAVRRPGEDNNKEQMSVALRITFLFFFFFRAVCFILSKTVKQKGYIISTVIFYHLTFLP